MKWIHGVPLGCIASMDKDEVLLSLLVYVGGLVATVHSWHLFKKTLMAHPSGPSH